MQRLLTTLRMVSGEPWLPLLKRGDHQVVQAGRASRRAVELFGSWGSFLTGDQSCDRRQHRVEVLASAGATRKSPPVLLLLDAVFNAEGV